MSILRRRDKQPQPEGLERGERVLASAALADGGVLAVTTYRIVVDGEQPERCPWHLVDGGGWRPERDEIWATFVDGREPGAWVLPDPGPVTDAFRERVQASVVLTEHVGVDRRDKARVVLRKDLATGALSVQTIYSEGADPDRPELKEQVDDALARLAEHVGLER